MPEEKESKTSAEELDGLAQTSLAEHRETVICQTERLLSRSAETRGNAGMASATGEKLLQGLAALCTNKKEASETVMVAEAKIDEHAKKLLQLHRALIQTVESAFERLDMRTFTGEEDLQTTITNVGEKISEAIKAGYPTLDAQTINEMTTIITAEQLPENPYEKLKNLLNKEPELLYQLTQLGILDSARTLVAQKRREIREKATSDRTTYETQRAQETLVMSGYTGKCATEEQINEAGTKKTPDELVGYLVETGHFVPGTATKPSGVGTIVYLGHRPVCLPGNLTKKGAIARVAAKMKAIHEERMTVSPVSHFQTWTGEGMQAALSRAGKGSTFIATAMDGTKIRLTKSSKNAVDVASKTAVIAALQKVTQKGKTIAVTAKSILKNPHLYFLELRLDQEKAEKENPEDATDDTAEGTGTNESASDEE